MHNKATPFWFIGFLSAFSLLSFDLYQPALPAITEHFNTTHSLGQLTLSLFFLVFGLSQIIWGPLIDHFGRRTTLRISLFIFFAATIVCIFATTINVLIIGRVLQGFAVCCSSVVAFSSTRDYEDSTERARVFSHISMIVSVSPIFAPLIGSLIFIYYGWHAIFVLMLLLGALLYLVSLFILKESPFWKKTDNSFRLYSSLANYKELLRHPQLWFGTVIITSSFSCIMIIIVNASYLIIDNLNHSPLFFSILFASNGLMIILGNFLGIQLRKKRPISWSIHFGSLIMVFGALIMLLAFFVLGFKIISLMPVMLISLGVSILSPATYSLALTDFDKQAATATAFINTFRMTIGATIAGILSAFIPNDVKILALGLLLCSLICWIFSLFITESPRKS
ncbi:MAG: multidrug effflux MFS transporter [Tatlockia sp.]|nr:multidrug effflux MFS transporter [Tatlockia sp.]